MRVVLDCNVLISAALKAGPPAQVVDLTITRHTLILSDDILAEYLEVAGRPKFRSSFRRLLEIIALISDIAEMVSPVSKAPALPDPDDEIYLATALAGSAQFLVTGNQRHFPDSPYEQTEIISPAQFLQRPNRP